MKFKTVAFLSLITFGATLGLYAEDKKPKDCPYKDCPCADGAPMGKGMGPMGHPMDKDHPRFKSLDTNKNGEISKEEWMAKYTEMDTNMNGIVSEEEMKKHHEKMQEKMREHMKEHKQQK